MPLRVPSISLKADGNNNKAIQFYKGLAIMAIMITHYSQLFKLEPDLLQEIPKYGQLFVFPFLILSCLGLCLSYEKKRPSYTAFIKHRFDKLSTGWYLMILIYLAIRLVLYFANLANGTLYETINLKGIIINILFLHGIYPDNIVNNTIVYGGWFVGTISIIYLIFPFLFKIYKKYKNILNCIIITLLIEIVLNLIIILIGHINPFFECTNNSFMYFNILNQLPSFCLGFVIYRLAKMPKRKKVNIYYYIAAAILFILSLIMYYTNQKYSFVFLPFIFSAMFVCVYELTRNKIEKNKSIISILINKIGGISWELYLVHPVFVYFIFKILNQLLTKIIPTDSFRYIILLPIFLISSFVAALLFRKIITRIKSTLNGLVKLTKKGIAK